MQTIVAVQTIVCSVQTIVCACRALYVCGSIDMQVVSAAVERIRVCGDVRQPVPETMRAPCKYMYAHACA